jgi:GNAT superfamily N-acetyltransferase
MLQRTITDSPGRLSQALSGKETLPEDPLTHEENLGMQEPLADGGVIRKLWIGEAARYRDHLLRLDQDSRHNRFGGGMSDESIRAYVRTTFGLRAVVHGFFVDGVLRGAAELRPLGPGFAREAEAALSIETAWQSHGVGSALLARTLLAARNRGLRTLHMACLANNRRMQDLARKFAAELSFDFGDVVGEVAAPRPTPLSVLREIVADNCGFATAVLDVQSRLLKARLSAQSPR